MVSWFHYEDWYSTIPTFFDVLIHISPSDSDETYYSCDSEHPRGKPKVIDGRVASTEHLMRVWVSQRGVGQSPTVLPDTDESRHNSETE